MEFFVVQFDSVMKTHPARLLIYFTSLCLFTLSNLFAQRLNIDNYSVKDGLVQSQVQTIIQDNDRYIWFGTVGGVSRYDGKEFVNYTRSDGLAANYVACALRDRQGNLWFGHDQGSISRFDWQTKQFETIQLSHLDKTLNDALITGFHQDARKRMWVATATKGLICLEGDSLKRFTSEDGLLSNRIYDIEGHEDERLWLATNRGIAIYDLNSATFDTLDQEKGLPGNTVLGLHTDRSGRIWIGTVKKGLIRFNPELKGDQRFKRFTKEDGLLSNMILDIYEDRFGHIWIINFEKGVTRAKFPDEQEGLPEFKTIRKENGLASNNILDIYEDIEGNIWLGSNGKGFSRFSGDLYEIYSSKEGLLQDAIWTIFRDHSGKYWFGSDAGINVIDPEVSDSEKRVSAYTKTKDYKIYYALKGFEDAQNNIWFLSLYLGPLRYHAKKDSFELFHLPDSLHFEVVDMVEAADGTFWFATFDSGLVRYFPQQSKFERYRKGDRGLLSDSLFFMHRTLDDRLWISSTYHGLMEFDGQRFIAHHLKNGKPLPPIKSMSWDGSESVWMLTNNDRIYRYDGQSFHDYSNLPALRKEALYSVKFHKKRVWIGTTHGVVKLNPKDSSTIQYDQSRGFPVLETNDNAVYKDRDGHLWFGTIHGAVKYMPENVVVNKRPPKTHIKDVQVLHKSVFKDSMLKERAFSHNENYFKFYFTGINLRVPDGVRFRYKLEGSDFNWSPPVNENMVTYSNLSPGKYTFKVKACNEHGFWDTQPAVYNFEILAPFWMQWWFYILSGGLIVSGAVGIVRYRIRLLQRTQKQLERTVDERTRELRQQKENVESMNRALRESEFKFRTYTETASSAIFIYQGMKFKYLNPAAETVTGYSREEMLKMNFWEIIHPDYREMIKQRGLQRQAGKKMPERYEFKIVRKDGKVRWLDYTARNIVHDGLNAVLGTAFDITDRKEMQAALMDEKERLSVTLSSIADGVITTDLAGKIVLCNRAAEAITGWTSDEAEGHYLNEIFNVEGDLNFDLSTDAAHIICSEKNDQISILMTKQKQKRFVEYNCAPIRNKESEIFGVVLAFRDITEKEQMKDELLKNQKLESIGILAGGIAHDFNNILTAITGNLSLLEIYVGDNEKAKQKISVAENACDRAQELTQQLLTFAKGGSPIKETASVSEIITEAAEFILRGSNVTYKMELSKRLNTIEVDTGQIIQVLHNLMINADQAMPEGGVITIRAKNAKITEESNIPLPPGKYVCVELADEGVGIPKKYLNKIFDPFFTTKKSGSGLGLATCYSIIKKHQGHLSVRSEIGHGTTFIMYLPASDKSIENHNKKGREDYQFQKQYRLLIMDDEVYVRDIAKEIFEDFGFKVATATDGADAVQLYKEAMESAEPFDFVILDLTIPGGMGGYRTLQKLQELDPEIKAMVTSGYSSDPIMSNYRHYGFVGRLKKPFKRNDIGRVLTTIICEESIV